jgi:L-ascorbate metabolism protein UlaG (beta-lactamase superfamily)
MKFTRRRVLGTIAALTGAGGASSLWAARTSNYYDGPVSDHFNGTLFVDPAGMEPRSFSDVLRWRFTADKAEWPARAPSPFCDTPPQCVTGPGWRFSFVGHASWLLQTAGLNLLIDPVWSERASPLSFAGPKRVNDPGIPFERLPPIDAVLITHNHYDHLDVATLSLLADRGPLHVFAPLGNDTIMKAHDPRIAASGHDWHERVDVGAGVAVTFVPARHWSARGLFDRNKALWAGFVIEAPAGRIYHAGDTGYGDGAIFRAVRERYGALRLAILPIGAYEPRWFMSGQHMNPEESVRAWRDCGAEFALAHHHGTFQLTDEAIDAPVQALAAALKDAPDDAARFRVLKPGEIFEI